MEGERNGRASGHIVAGLPRAGTGGSTQAARRSSHPSANRRYSRKLAGERARTPRAVSSRARRPPNTQQTVEGPPHPTSRSTAARTKPAPTASSALCVRSARRRRANEKRFTTAPKRSALRRVKPRERGELNHFLYQHAWTSPERTRWWRRRRGAELLVAVDRRAEQRWGYGATSSRSPRRAERVKARARNELPRRLRGDTVLDHRVSTRDAIIASPHGLTPLVQGLERRQRP